MWWFQCAFVTYVWWTFTTGESLLCALVGRNVFNPCAVAIKKQSKIDYILSFAISLTHNSSSLDLKLWNYGGWCTAVYILWKLQCWWWIVNSWWRPFYVRFNTCTAPLNVTHSLICKYVMYTNLKLYHRHKNGRDFCIMGDYWMKIFEWSHLSLGLRCQAGIVIRKKECYENQLKTVCMYLL